MSLAMGRARAQAPLPAAPFHRWLSPNGRAWLAFYRSRDGYVLRFPRLADFRVSGAGLAVRCHPAPGATRETCLHLYRNQVRPLVLSKRGKFVFHASAVDVGGRAAAFVAESGRGKSTLAASFASAGHRFLTDDGLLLEPCARGFRVLPGDPSIRLWDDSRRALARGARMAPPVSYTSKARFLAGGEFRHGRIGRPLARAYFLGPGRARSITLERMTPAEAAVAWVRSAFLLDLEERALLASHFDRVAQLANTVPCYRLDYPRRFRRLPEVRDAVVRHLNSIS